MKRNDYAIAAMVLVLVVSVPAMSTAALPLQEQPDSTFEVSELSAPDSVEQGEQLEVEATVTNNGSDGGQATVEYTFDGDVQQSKQVNLDGGESEDVEFKFNTQNVDAGNYTHGVSTADDSATAEVEIEAGDDDGGDGPPSSGEFEVSDLTAPDNVSQGEQLEVGATVTNNGSDRGQATVEYKFDGTAEQSRQVNLGADESETVEFRFNTRNVEAGNYTHGVYTDSDNATAEIEILADDDNPGEGPPDDIAEFQDTRPLDPNQTEPSSLAGQLRVESQLRANTSVTLTSNSSTEYSLEITVTEEAENVTFFLQSQAVEASQDIENVTAYLDGEEMDFYVDESAGPGNSPWILFEVDHFSTRTVTFASEERNELPTIVGDTPVQDTDGDGNYEDISGDGEFTLEDVRLLFENRNGAAVQNNVGLFDFDGDGQVTLADVQVLYRELF